jgi:hypothetical protein
MNLKIKLASVSTYILQINMKTLIVVAHPDDEILWFLSIILREDADVVCVSCGRNAADSKIRKRAFIETMRLLDVSNYRFLNYNDSTSRLNVKRLITDLKKLDKDKYEMIYTHGYMGEIYNHVHHQDLSFAVHQVFENVMSISWNQYPSKINVLTAEEYNLKKYILGTIYYQEYDLLADAYEISAIEKFICVSKEASEILYFSSVNFGDHHELLGVRYCDFWGFKNSPYEMERHEAIRLLAQKIKPKNILEYGACEGILSEKLRGLAPVYCVEKSSTFRKRLKKKGFEILHRPENGKYDVVIVASFLEYLQRPTEFIRKLNSRVVIADVILGSKLEQAINKELVLKYKLIDEKIVRPRWERMFWGEKKENVDVYRLGSHVYLYEKR